LAQGAGKEGLSFRTLDWLFPVNRMGGQKR
jgi:hypothetical protein